MNCLLCENEGCPQRIYIIGQWVMRNLCDPCKDWLAGEIPTRPES